MSKTTSSAKPSNEDNFAVGSLVQRKSHVVLVTFSTEGRFFNGVVIVKSPDSAVNIGTLLQGEAKSEFTPFRGSVIISHL